MKVHHYSVGRSGCTFISQLLVGIFGLDKLSAGHTPYFLESGQPVVLSVRDFRDVALSFWRVQNDIPFSDIERGRQATLEEIKPQINLVKLAVKNDLNPTFKNSTFRRRKKKNPNFSVLRSRRKNYFLYCTFCLRYYTYLIKCTHASAYGEGCRPSTPQTIWQHPSSEDVEAFL